MRPKICLLFAGGTIGMIRNRETGALQPASNAMELIQNFPELQKIIQLDFKMICNMDSSNLNPTHWTEIAKTIHTLYHNYEGFIVVQGTDTMAYAASALSFALQNLSKPIVFTGSLIPTSEIGSDARNNLIYACLTATLDIAEVCMIFSNMILRANRTKKFHESFVASFHSPNYPLLGELGRPIHLNEWRKRRRKRVLKFYPYFDSKISVLRLFPGFDPNTITRVIEGKAHGIIIEGFGPGNVPFLENSIIPKIEESTQKNIPIIITNQMEKGVTNLNAYEAGLYAHKAGAISSHDMTTEATVTKLMWALSKTEKLKPKKQLAEIRRIFENNLAGEMDQ